MVLLPAGIEPLALATPLPWAKSETWVSTATGEALPWLSWDWTTTLNDVYAVGVAPPLIEVMPSCVAVPAVMLKPLLVPFASPALDATSVYAVPILFSDRPLNVATPATA